LVYPLIGWGAWRHRLELVAAGATLEALLWTAVPPVEETFGFVEGAIEAELNWLNAPPGAQKSLSFAVLAAFPIVAFAGLWRRSWRLLGASAGLIVVFYFLMHRLGAKSPFTSRKRRSRGCLRRVDVGDQGLLQSSQNGKMTAETLLYSPAKADFGGLLGLSKTVSSPTVTLRPTDLLSRPETAL
jgi:hypothetical protein